MHTKYRISSEAFGPYLEKMATGLIDKFINTLSYAAHKRNYSAYFRVGWEWTGKFGTERIYYIEVFGETSKSDLLHCIWKGYMDFFHHCNYDFAIINYHAFLRLSFEDNYTWDKYNKTFLPVLTIHDQNFFPFHNKAIQWWLK